MNEGEHARSILEMAQKDLKALRGMLDPEVFEDEIFGFHAQQAVEKALKAWIAALGEQYPHTHDLSALLADLEKLGVDVGGLWDLVEYNAFAVQFRYQGLPGGEESLDREEVLGKVGAVMELARRVQAQLERRHCYAERVPLL